MKAPVNNIAKKMMVGLTALTIMGGAMAPMAEARDWRDYRNDRYDRGGSITNSQYFKKGAIGAVAGAGVGALVARDGRRMSGAVKGGLLGAGAGLAYEWIRRR